MIEERCNNVDNLNTNTINTNSRVGFAQVMSGLVGDIVERIVYRYYFFGVFF